MTMISFHHIGRMCWLAAAALWLAGCSQEFSDSNDTAQIVCNAALDETSRSKADASVSAMLPEDGAHDTLFLTAVSEPMAVETLTRGQLTTMGRFESNGQFRLYMKQQDESAWAVADLCYSHQGNGIWTTPSAPEWPRTGTLDFYACAPYGDAVVQASDARLGASLSGGGLQPFVVNANNAQQCDLLVASATGLSGKFFLPVPLRFQHALTAVQFVMADDIMPGTVKGITIKNVANAGTYSFSTGSWSSAGTTGTFTLDCAKEVAPNQGGASITGSLYYFWMMPQNFAGSSATVELKFDDGSGEQTFSCSLAGTSAWQQGHLVTFTVSTASLKNQYTLQLSSSVSEIPYQGGDVPALQVVSKRTVNSTSTAVPWTLQYSYDQSHWFDSKDDETGSDIWLTSFAGASGTGHATNAQTIPTGTLQVEKMPHLLNPGRTYTFGAAKGTKAAPFDLSTDAAYVSGTYGSTANCYIVDAPGWYCFPLVYGNAIQQGMVYQDAFNFVPANLVVSSPANVFVRDAAACQVLWEQNGCAALSDLSLFDGQYARFYVNPQMEDNVLIAARSSTGHVLWSWHIWVKEPGMATATVTSPTSSVDYDFLGENLGQVDGSGILKYGTGSSASGDRMLYLRAIAVDGAVRSNTLTLTQTHYSETLQTTSLKYQFGRKDPFYDGQLLSVGNAADNMQDFIRYPALWRDDASNNDIWYTTAYDTWWTGKNFTDNLAEETVKTIFDPCPADFKVPAGDAFRSFSASNGTVTGTGADKGRKFKNKSNVSDDNLLFKYHQYRLVNGTLATGAEGRYWSAMRYNADHAYCMTISDAAVEPTENQPRAMGYAVRPVWYDVRNQVGVSVEVDDPSNNSSRPVDPVIVSQD